MLLLQVMVQIFSWPVAAVAQHYLPQTARVVGRAKVIDGDTIHIRQGGRFYAIRIFGLDAPEMDSRQGVMAKAAMVALLQPTHFVVSCISDQQDKYHRLVAVCYKGRNFDGAPLAISMLQSGYGFAYRRFLTADTYATYLSAEAAARQQGNGFWADKNFVRRYQASKHFH